MATWEDGPEYAPVDRPTEFALPAGPATVLTAEPPAPRMAEPPVQRPVFNQPPVPVAELAALIPVAPDTRDPQLPFEVAAATLTSDSVWGSAGGPLGPTASPTEPFRPSLVGPTLVGPSAPTAYPPPPGPWGPPPDPSLPGSRGAVPVGPIVNGPGPYGPPPNGSYPPPPGFPSAGTPGWFGPGPAQPPPVRGPVTVGQVVAAATPGLVVTLVVAGLIPVTSPVMLVIATLLTRQVRTAGSRVRLVLRIAVGFVAFIGLVVGLSGSSYGFADWWSVVGGWSVFTSWVSLVVVLLLVTLELRKTGAPPRRANWG